MKVLQVNGYESPGRRFNGLALTPWLAKYGIESRHLIWDKDTQDPAVLTFEGKWARPLTQRLAKLEQRYSLQSLLYPNAWQMMRMPAFKEAEVLHLHIIHSGYLSLAALPWITRRKPTVWTLHDPWAMTGHCIYPMDCTRWKTGCGSCPDLTSQFELARDRTRLLFRLKRRAYRKARFDVIVASTWMRDMVDASPLFEGVTTHLVPFGIDLDVFSPTAAARPRARFGIPEEALVICFRAIDNQVKGLPYILHALDKLRSRQPVYLLTFNTKGLLVQFADRFSLVELGWVNDEELTRDAYLASDIFLMPSTAEAFGVMAIEAMACGRPVICFAGTSLPAVTFAPEVGIVVPMRDGDALANALQRLADSPRERRERGAAGRRIAQQHYGIATQARHLAQIYQSVAQQ